MSRAEFLSRVRQAVESGRPYQIHVDRDRTRRGYVGAVTDPPATLAAEIQQIGGEAQVADTWTAAQDLILQSVQEFQVRSALCWQHPTLDRLGVTELLQSQGVTMYGYAQLAPLSEQERRRIVLQADIGISGADYAIAETGTLAVCAAAGQERISTLVPPIHLAVIHQGQIIPDLFDLFDVLAERYPESLPSAIALISGPSKTGDIELELTTGVHGPGKWRVIIVRESI